MSSNSTPLNIIVFGAFVLMVVLRWRFHWRLGTKNLTSPDHFWASWSYSIGLFNIFAGILMLINLRLHIMQLFALAVFLLGVVLVRDGIRRARQLEAPPVPSEDDGT